MRDGVIARLLRRVRRTHADPSVALALSPQEAAQREQAASGELARMFFAHRGRLIHKQTHYLEIYERYFSPFRGGAVRMLEIGVFKGGSLDLWRKYFGPEATVFGVDVDPECAAFAEPPNQVRIGSQDDSAFLRSVVAEMGRPHIVLDDGSHLGRHQRRSFEVLFPLLEEGGLYVIEDLCTSYWRRHEGGYRRRGTGIELVKELIDDLHARYHDKGAATPAQDFLKAVHVHDSIVVLEKGRMPPPGHVQVG
jgi:hypothetical protein